MTQLKGRPFYQGRGKKYFYNLGDARGRQAARLKADASNQTGGAAFRFNTQTPERMAEIQAKYKGQAHPDFIDQYADILADRPRMSGWRGNIPSNLWYPEEHASYLRDGSPKSKEDFSRIMGTWGNPRQY